MKCLKIQAEYLVDKNVMLLLNLLSCNSQESPVFGASGQEELAKRLAELELNREFLNVLGDEQDWFDEDYGLSSRKVQQKQAEEPAVLPKVEPQKVPPKPCEELLAVPHTAVEVESMVHAAAEELWKLKELGHDLQSFSLHTDFSSTSKEQDTDSINKQVYKKVQSLGILFLSFELLL